MKHLSLAVLAATVALGLTSFQARADLVVLDAKAPAKPVAIKAVPPVTATPAPNLAPNLAPSLAGQVQTTLAAPAAVLAAASPAAAGDLVVVSPDGPAVASQGRLIQVGAPLPGPAVEGWATDVPLSLALDQILPKGWTLESHGVAMDAPVSWRGGRSWHAILGDLSYGYRFDSRVDWVSQRVTLGPSGSLAPSVAGSPAPVRKEAAPAPVVVATPTAVVAPKPLVPVVLTWTLDPRKTLRENIEAWTQKAGWNQVVWEGADYPVVAPATFTGAFDSPQGPVATVISAYDDSDQPLLATLHRKDRVVHVTNRNFMPTTVVPTAPAQIVPDSFPLPEAPVGN